MTVIAAYTDAWGNTAIAADRLCSVGAHKFEGPSKLHHIPEGWIVGLAGVALWGQFVREAVEGIQEASSPLGDELPYALADAWMQWGQDRQHGSGEGGHFGLVGELLLVRHGDIVLIGGDGSVIRPADRYAAIGSGAEVALGALALQDEVCHMLKRSDAAAEEIVRRAANAARKHAQGCGGFVDVIGCEPQHAATGSEEE